MGLPLIQWITAPTMLDRTDRARHHVTRFIRIVAGRKGSEHAVARTAQWRVQIRSNHRDVSLEKIKVVSEAIKTLMATGFRHPRQLIGIPTQIVEINQFDIAMTCCE